MAKNYKLTSGAQRLLAADATRILIAAPIANHAIKLFSMTAAVRVAAAQLVDVAPASGASTTNTPMSLPASFAGVVTREWSDGFELPAGIALNAIPAAPGPEIQFSFEYSIVPVWPGA